MEELVSILNAHHNLYPKMQFDDVYKLIYQHCYGPKHMCMSYEDIYNSIKEESLQSLSTESEILDIGNGFIRVSICKDEESVKRIADLFFKSIQFSNEEISFEKVLISFKKDICDIFNFDEVDFTSKLNSYREQGFPIISHSDIYKENYDPHYRVIKKALFDLK